MNAVILSAGRAVRLGTLAPRGCKVLAKVNGVSVLRRQLDLLDGLVDDVTVVCRSTHVQLLRAYPVELVAHDLFDGPVGALEAAEPQGDTLIVYGDTLWTGLPNGDEWIGAAHAGGGRKWDVIRPRGITYEWVPEDERPLVCVGVYRVAHAEQLTGPSMPEALAKYGVLPYRPVNGWHDVGDVDGVASFGEPEKVAS